MAQSTSGGYRPHIKMDLGELAKQGTIKDSRLVSQVIDKDKPGPKIIKENMQWLSATNGTGSGVVNLKFEMICTIISRDNLEFNKLVQLLLDNEMSYTCFEGCVIMKKEDLNSLIYE